MKTKKTRNLPGFLLFLLLILSVANLSSSQSNSDSPRNLETFYPFALSPPPPPPPSGPSPSPENGVVVQRPSPSSSGTSKKALMAAVGATAASMFMLAALFFLVFLCVSRARKRKEMRNGGGGIAQTPQLPPAVMAAGSRSEYRKLGGNVRGYIIDEDGLDVLYWKKLTNSGGFKKEPYNSAGKRPAVSRGRSSSSHPHLLPRQISSSDRSHSGPNSGQLPALSATAVPKSAVTPPPPPPQPVKNTASVPPPPPPAPGKKIPPPPPPSKPRTKTLESVPGEGVGGSGNDDQVKLKPLHWEKVNINPNQTNVWNKIENGSFQYNGDMMEALFGVVATNRRSPRSQNSTDFNAGESSAKIFILEPRKSQNIAIVIKSLGIPLDELIESLLQGNDLAAETLEKLTRAAPTKEEASKIIAFNQDPANLADAESFLYHLLKAVPNAFTRIDEMLFRLTYDSEISTIKESLQTLEQACNELRNRGIFLKLLEAILKAGNRLNAGTARGDAKAFNLTTLRKLSDYKSSDGKTTLLHFVVHEVVRNEGRRCVLSRSNSIGRGNATSDDPASKDEREKEFLKLGLPVVGGLSSEFLNVKMAATIDYDVLNGSISSIETSLKEKGSADGEFFEAAEVEMKSVQDEHLRILSLVKRTTQYYQAGASNDRTPLQLFVIVKDFLATVDQTCVEIARSLQQKKQVTGGSGPGSGSGSGLGSPQADHVLRSRVTFPRLPEHFLSDKSSSGLDDDDSQ